MTEITKEAFLREKIKNFTIFIGEKIGKDNSIYTDFVEYEKDLNKFLQAIIRMNNICKNVLSEENVKKYLEYNGITVNLIKSDYEKIGRYFEMFIKVINL